jgi:hypothetical protein
MGRYATYSLYQGAVREKTSNAKKIAIGIIVSVGIAGVCSLPAFAASNSYCGSSANGCAAAGAAGAQCGTGAGSGAFGYFGLSNNMSGGANGHQTGLNNSAICGNRQGNL